MYSTLITALTAINLQPYLLWVEWEVNPLKCSGVRQLHLKVFSAIQV